MRDRIDKKGLIEESLALLDFVKDLLDFCKTLCKI